MTAQATGGGTPIPPNGAVLLSVGTQAPKLAAEATPGTPVRIQLVLTPDWPSAGIETRSAAGL